MSIRIEPHHVTFTAMRAQGAGGQNVDKVSSAVHLRFDIGSSSLPDDVKARLVALDDRRITRDGVVVIKAQSSRSQEANRLDALSRLQALVDGVATAPKVRRPTKPTKASRKRRLETKALVGKTKAGRRRVE